MHKRTFRLTCISGRLVWKCVDLAQAALLRKYSWITIPRGPFLHFFGHFFGFPRGNLGWGICIFFVCFRIFGIQGFLGSVPPPRDRTSWRIGKLVGKSSQKIDSTQGGGLSIVTQGFFNEDPMLIIGKRQRVEI